MFDQLLENTILLFVAVDPIALVPIFASLNAGTCIKVDIKKGLHSGNFGLFRFVLSLFYLFGTAILDADGHIHELI